MKASLVFKELDSMKDREKAEGVARFFKCGQGEYGAGDLFLGIAVPQQKKLAKKYQSLPLPEVLQLILSKYHEARLTGLLILVQAFVKADVRKQEKIYRFYLAHSDRINNWDLVDATTPHIVGMYLWKNPQERKTLYRLMRSKNMWERRMAILATFTFLRQGYFKDTLRISEGLLSDKEDLIHKSVGWMLREVGKRDRSVLENFLARHLSRMSRTTLRYAIEHFSEKKRKKYLKK
jgi:3-methyladenine DNA glycosylase AlkD